MTIPATRTKNHTELILTLPPQALKILRDVPRIEGQPYLFGSKPGRGFSAWSSAKLALDHRITAETGQVLPRWTLHDLRRTMRTGLSTLGVQPHVAELAIGHAKHGIIGVYDQHKHALEITAALKLWADHVTAAVEGKTAKVTPLRAA